MTGTLFWPNTGHICGSWRACRSVRGCGVNSMNPIWFSKHCCRLIGHAISFAERHRIEWSEVRLRFGAVRRLCCAARWRIDSILYYSGVGRGRTKCHHDRRSWQSSKATPVAKGVHCRAGNAVWILRQRHYDDGGGPAVHECIADER